MQAARAEIVAGRLRGAALVERLLAIPYLDRDAWIDEVLGFPPPPADSPDLPCGAVPYLPCGVDEILTMVREVTFEPDDELVDIGSGLGRVAILAHLLTGVPARGIEIQEPLVQLARARSAALRLPDVTFEHADVAELAHDGSIFFLYAPCNGEMLRRVLQRLAEVARRRPIVVCAVGVALEDESWLEVRVTSSPSVAIYDSVMPDVRRRLRTGQPRVFG